MSQATRPDIYDRIIARAERIEAARAQVRRDVAARVAAKSSTPSRSATARWKTAVAIAKQSMPNAQAVESVDRSNPGLRESMLAEVNRPASRSTPARPEARVYRSSYATAQWRDAVDAELAQGLTRHQAVMAADRRHPGLRESMLAEANAR